MGVSDLQPPHVQDVLGNVVYVFPERSAFSYVIHHLLSFSVGRPEPLSRLRTPPL
jgi:hypothetical protein